MKIQVFYPLFPLPKSEAAHHVVVEQMEAMVDLGHEVELLYWVGKEERGKTQHSWNAKYIGMNASEKESAFKRLIRTFFAVVSGQATVEEFYYPNWLRSKVEVASNSDLQIFHYSFAYKIFRCLRKKSSKRIVYFHNLESDLFKLRADNESNFIKRFIHELSSARLRKHELDLVSLADESWFITEKDSEELRKRSKLKELPNARIVPPAFAEKVREFRNEQFRNKTVHFKKARLGFIGALDFEPNRQGLLWILKELLPELEKNGFRGEICHVGRKDPEIEKLAAEMKLSHVSVNFLGFVDDLEEWWATLSFSMVPDLTGAGVRIKLLESVASGVPVLTTHMGIERCAPAVQKSELVFASDDPAKWAEQIVKYQPFELRKKMLSQEFNSGLNGRKIYHFLE